MKYVPLNPSRLMLIARQPIFGGGMLEQLQRIYTSMTRLHHALLEHQRTTDARLIALDEHVRDLQGVRGSRPHEPAREIAQSARQVRKDSSANYLRVR